MVHRGFWWGRFLPRHVLTSFFCAENPHMLKLGKTSGTITAIDAKTRSVTSTAQATQKVLKSFKDIPGPPNTPFLGNVLGFKNPEFGHDRKHVLKTARHMWEQYGDMFRLEIPGKNPIIWYAFL